MHCIENRNIDISLSKLVPKIPLTLKKQTTNHKDDKFQTPYSEKTNKQQIIKMMQY
jgi:hypothetical protein